MTQVKLKNLIFKIKMNLLAVLATLFMVLSLSDSGEGKPLFFDAVTGALNEIRKIIFGGEQGLLVKYESIELEESNSDPNKLLLYLK